jgi:carboxypeptidase family protein
MKLIQLIVVCLTLSVTATPLESSVLKGVVTDTVEGAPIAGAYVLVHRSLAGSGDVRVPVQRDGSFSVNLSPGCYDVLVTAVGFSPTCTKVELRQGKTELYNPRLEMSKVESAESAQNDM